MRWLRYSPAEILALRDAQDWRHRRTAGAMAIGVGILVRAWAKDVPAFLEAQLAESMGRYLPED